MNVEMFLTMFRFQGSEIKYIRKRFQLFDDFTCVHECTTWSSANRSYLLCFRDLGSLMELGLNRGRFQYGLVELLFLIHRAVRMNSLKLKIHASTFALSVNNVD